MTRSHYPKANSAGSHRLPPARRESGVVLIVGLVLLAVLTLLGITAMQTTTLEERMSGNYEHRVSGFQAAESALRQAEQALKGGALVFDDTGGHYTAPIPGDPPRWLTIYGSGGQPANGATVPVAGQARASYFIEELLSSMSPGQNLSTAQYANEGSRQQYQITAFGTGPAKQSNVILQSVFRP